MGPYLMQSCQIPKYQSVKDTDIAYTLVLSSGSMLNFVLSSTPNATISCLSFRLIVDPILDAVVLSLLYLIAKLPCANIFENWSYKKAVWERRYNRAEDL